MAGRWWEVGGREGGAWNMTFYESARVPQVWPGLQRNKAIGSSPVA